MVEKLTKKQKKTNEFRGKKRKLDDSIADVPEEDTLEAAAAAEKASNKAASVKQSKKDGSKDSSSKEDKAVASADGSTADHTKKKRKRGKGSSKEGGESTADGKDGAEGDKADGAAKDVVKAPPKNQRFIVFVGNLPYNITKEQLEKHFENCKITSVRIQTDKVTGKGKGFAFLELPDVDSMQKALFFNKTLIKERPINVELTAGGGGNKSAGRKQKIAEKNEALNEERRKLHEKHIAPAKEAKSSYAAANPPVVQKAPPKNIKKPSEISNANAISVEGLSARLRKA
ncbi:hypothetical protein BGZ99_005448 [Dissophora globulifera]|uniref:RRM domain-containing protein n=1 Tax=Dissophora globulifera TaxID=979702 RepID=A0A9P6UTE1_9FUNG|nr:hypothetical protein BGZ99_005448 [Dissophora globulifera]